MEEAISKGKEASNKQRNKEKANGKTKYRPYRLQKGHRSRERQGGRTNQDSRMTVKVQGGNIERRREKVYDSP